ncbi:MAG: alpha/beta hydrolase [Polaromonas sp.]
MQNDHSATIPTHLLLLPGLMCDGDFWLPLQQGLPDVACQVVDYGEADSLRAMAEAALAVAPARFALAGHSMGGRVALEIVRMAPSRVQKLILMDTGYLPRSDGPAGDTERAGRMALIKLANDSGVRAMCQEWVKGMVHPDRLNDSVLIEAIVAMFTHKDAERFARQQNALLTRPDASSVLSGLGMPCLLLCGRQDNWATVAQHAAMQALAPGAQLSVVEQAGHMVLMEQPVQTSDVIYKFLKSSAELSC